MTNKTKDGLFESGKKNSLIERLSIVAKGPSIVDPYCRDDKNDKDDELEDGDEFVEVDLDEYPD